MTGLRIAIVLCCASLAFGGWVGTNVPTDLQPSGSATEAAGTWTVQGAGWDIWGAGDGFFYNYEDVAFGDDFAVSCRIVSLDTAPHGWTKAGIMARASNPAAPPLFSGAEDYVFAMVSRDNGFRLQYRDLSVQALTLRNPGSAPARSFPQALKVLKRVPGLLSPVPFCFAWAHQFGIGQSKPLAAGVLLE